MDPNTPNASATYSFGSEDAQSYDSFGNGSAISPAMSNSSAEVPIVSLDGASEMGMAEGLISMSPASQYASVFNHMHNIDLVNNIAVNDINGPISNQGNGSGHTPRVSPIIEHRTLDTHSIDSVTAGSGSNDANPDNGPRSPSRKRSRSGEEPLDPSADDTRLKPPNLEITKTTEVKSRACDECRRRKTACYYVNGEDSKCFRCQVDHIECTFSDRRNAPRSAQPPARSATRRPTNPTSTDGPVTDYSQLPGRSLLKKTLSLQHPRSSFAVGQHGLWDQRVLESVVLDKTQQAHVAVNLGLRKVGADSWFMLRTEGDPQRWVKECDEIERLVYPYGRALVTSYFTHFHPSYPILHERIFLEKYSRTHRELMPALLGCVYLLGMRWWNANPELVTVPPLDHAKPTLYDLALISFFKSSGGASLSLIQAGLLLLQCSFSDPKHLGISAVINTTAFRLALNRNCLHWKLPRWEINLRLRLGWATYTQSTWIALFESVPPLVQDSSWFLAPLNTDILDLASSEPAVNGMLFIQLNKLSLIVHDMHNLLSLNLYMMYSNPAAAQQAVNDNANTNYAETSVPQTIVAPEDILEMIKPIQIRLRRWYLSLPQPLLDLSGDIPTGNFSLRVAYLAAEVTLHRFIVRVVSAASDAGAKNAEINSVVRSSAYERLEMALETLRLLRPQHLQQFWHFPAAHQLAVVGLFAALMYVTSATNEERQQYRTILTQYISLLQIYSDNDVIGSALRVLRCSIAGVPGLLAPTQAV